jgi:hypothetical protein
MPTPDLSRAIWRKSTRSGSNGDACVEVARNLPDIVAVRDSKDPGGRALTFSPDEWTAFLAGVKDGPFGIQPRRVAMAFSIRRWRVSGFFALSMARTCSRLWLYERLS